MFTRSLRLIVLAAAAAVLTLLCFVCVALVQARPRSAPLLLSAVVLVSVVLVGWWGLAGVSRRRSRTTAVLAYLEQAIRHNLPLPRMIHAIAQSEPFMPFARDLESARETLERGGPLAAVLGALPELPPQIVSLVASAEHTAQLPQVLARIIKQRQAALERAGRGVPFYRVYPLLFAALFIVVTSMLMVFVMPKFEQIFRDFNTQMPGVTILTLQIARAVGAWAWLILLAILIGCIYVAAMTRSRAAGLGLIERPWDWIGNRLPWVGNMRRDRALAEALEFVADAIESGRLLDRSLDSAAQLSANSRVNRMIQRWSQRIGQGEPIGDAARAAGLPALVCGMVATANHTPDLAAVFRFLARYYSTRFSRGSELMNAAAVPLLALAMGMMVAWLALSVFAPLIALIQTVSVPYSGVWR